MVADVCQAARRRVLGCTLPGEQREKPGSEQRRTVTYPVIEERWTERSTTRSGTQGRPEHHPGKGKQCGEVGEATLCHTRQPEERVILAFDLYYLCTSRPDRVQRFFLYHQTASILYEVT